MRLRRCGRALATTRNAVFTALLRLSSVRPGFGSEERGGGHRYGSGRGRDFGPDRFGRDEERGPRAGTVARDSAARLWLRRPGSRRGIRAPATWLGRRIAAIMAAANVMGLGTCGGLA